MLLLQAAEDCQTGLRQLDDIESGRVSVDDAVVPPAGVRAKVSTFFGFCLLCFEAAFGITVSWACSCCSDWVLASAR